jgi:hypothetical protein
MDYATHDMKRKGFLSRSPGSRATVPTSRRGVGVQDGHAIDLCYYDDLSLISAPRARQI